MTAYVVGNGPAFGRMLQIDPLAGKYNSLTPYNYAFNNPVYWNDPAGADPDYLDEYRNRIEEMWDAYEKGGLDGMAAFYIAEGMSLAEASANVSDRIEELISAALSGSDEVNVKVTNMSYGKSGSSYVLNYGYWDYNTKHDIPVSSPMAVLIQTVVSSNQSRFFASDQDAYYFMWNNSFRNGKPWRENAAFVVDGGVIVLPTEGYDYDRKFITGNYLVNEIDQSNNGLIPYEKVGGKRNVFLGEKEYQVLAEVHTHPNGWSQSPGAGDFDWLSSSNISTIFTIGTKDVYGGVIINNVNTPLYVGPQSSVINGTISLRDFISN